MLTVCSLLTLRSSRRRLLTRISTPLLSAKPKLTCSRATCTLPSTALTSFTLIEREWAVVVLVSTFATHTEFKYFICEIRRNQLKLLFAAVYHCPHAAYPIHFPSVIITGDFYMNMALPDSPAASHLNHSINSNSRRLVHSEPTHHQPWRGSHTWIDLFLVKSDDRVLAYRKSPAPFIAGHDIIELTLACSKPPPIARRVPLRSLKRVNLGELERHLTHQLETSPVSSPFTPNTFIATSPSTELVLGPCSADVDRCEDTLAKALLSASDAVAPLRSVVLSSRRKPWVSPQIRALMKTRDRAYKLACNFRTPTNLAQSRAYARKYAMLSTRERIDTLLHASQRPLPPKPNGVN